MITVDLKSIFKARGIEYPSKFLISIGITRNVVSALVNGYARHIKLDNIEKICRALNCEPNDLFRFQIHPQDPLPKEHPLFSLIREDTAPDLQTSLRAIPYKQLMEASKSIQHHLNPETTNLEQETSNNKQ